ncbi:MAG TPA: glycosyltransferase family 2 protein [Aquaticitalea sp.]|nr:glycosyltransferase family 2 protein [Aquaticitalea sp.]HNU59951.1 glycosyltransferase family 2 protein [Aquaticitalea sp.]
MKISIITATYNSAKTLNVCMDSVLNQTYRDIEYLIIDGNSTDATVDLIKAKAAAHPHIVWVSGKDKGIYDALNKGIEKATGDVIGFVHSDDFLADSTIVEKIASVFNTQQVDGVYGNLHYVKFDAPGTIVRNWVSQPFRKALLNRGWMPAHPTLFLKKSVYQNHGVFDLTYKIAADYDFILRVFSNPGYKFFYLPETFTKMRVGGASNRSIKNLILKSKEDYRAAKSNGLPRPLFSVIFKNISKIPQWLSKS